MLFVIFVVAKRLLDKQVDLSYMEAHQRGISETTLSWQCGRDLLRLPDCLSCQMRAHRGRSKSIALLQNRGEVFHDLLVRSDDPRMARVLGEYPKLDRWSRWQLAEAESTYVLSTHSWVRQILLVVHKETLAVLYAAVAGRIYSPWQEMSQLQRDDLLG